jgi:hypothetical protein
MKILAALPLLFVSLSSFGYNGKKLCYQAGQNNLRSYFADGLIEEKVLSAKVVEYYVGQNLANNEIVQYQYDVKTNERSHYVRITMDKQDCQLIAAGAYGSKQDMNDDDLDAAQGGGSND